ncbi:MAG: tetratricopeptide repeat protein [Anaerolineae bacterium]|nr:tetratricopeptide repeat protein [Anaerolineae bacterium]
MTNPKLLLQRLHQSLHTLKQQQVKHGINAPASLIREIEDHQTAIDLTEQLAAGRLSEIEWGRLKPLLVTIEERQATKSVSSLNIGGVNFSDINNSSITVGDIFVHYVTNPPSIQIIYQDLGQFIKQNRLYLSVVLLLQIPLAVVFFVFKNRFLIPWWVYLVLVLLLGAMVYGWLKLFEARVHQKTVRLYLALGGFSTVFWLGLFGWQLASIVYPVRFAKQDFGIAVAMFGSGANFRVSARGQEITDLVYRQLDEFIRNSPAALKDVKLARLGVVNTIEQGQADGERIGAKLVLWGQILERGDETIIHFQVLQTPGLTDNPAIPQTLPLVRRPLQTNVGIQSIESLTIKNVASLQSLAAANFSLGLFYYLKFDFQNAVDQFEMTLNHLKESQYSRDATDPGLVYYYLGRSYQQLGAFDQSQAMFDQAATFNPDDPAIALGQAYNYRVLGQMVKRQQALEAVLTMTAHEKDIVAIYDRALAFERLKDFQAALDEYRAINTLDPDFFIAYLSRGRILVQLDRLDEAEEIYQQAQQRADGDPIRQAWIWVDLGQLYEKKDDPEAAIEAYKQAVALVPTLSTPYFFLAQIYAQQGITDGAYLNYQQLTVVSQNPSWAHGAFGGYLFQQKSYVQAIDQYKKALRYPAYDAPRLYADLGQAYAYADVKDFPDKKALSIEAFEEAIKNPGPYEAYVRSIYGQILFFDFGIVEEAINQHLLSLKADESIGVETRLNLGQIYESTGQFNLAREQYQILVEAGSLLPADRLAIAQNRLAVLEK